MFIMLGAWCILRVTYIETVLHLFHNISLVFLAYPITWALSGAAFILYYRRSGWLEKIQKVQGS